jgi:hypothetical protein
VLTIGERTAKVKMWFGFVLRGMMADRNQEDPDGHRLLTPA